MRLVSTYKNFRFEVEEDFPEVGFYLYVFDESGKCIEDHLQNDLDTTKRFAFEYFGVPIDSWSIMEE